MCVCVCVRSVCPSPFLCMLNEKHGKTWSFPRCNFVPCDLFLHKHQKSGNEDITGCVPAKWGNVYSPVYKQRSSAAFVFWREQLAFVLTMFVFQLFRVLRSCEHEHWYDRSYACRFGLNRPPHFCQTSLCSLPFWTSACFVHFHNNCSQPSTQFLFGCLGRLALKLIISTKDRKGLPRLSAKTIQTIANLHHIFTTRSTTKNLGMRTPLDHNNNNKNMFRILGFYFQNVLTECCSICVLDCHPGLHVALSSISFVGHML